MVLYKTLNELKTHFLYFVDHVTKKDIEDSRPKLLLDHVARIVLPDLVLNFGYIEKSKGIL